jgi:NADH:ubiquinone oxidoreductase subunit E
MTDKELKAIISEYPQERRFALAVMQDMQRHYTYVPRRGLELLARHFNCKIAELYSMVTFYKAFSLKPKGKHIIRLCDGTACHIRGSVNLINCIQRELGISAGETTDDGEFTLELVNCLGSCALAPVMVVDGKYYGKVTLEKMSDILAEYRKGAK